MKPQRQYQQGAAVIMALLITTLAVTLVAHLFWRQQVQYHSIENQRLQSQAQWIMRGALDWARFIVREDGQHSTIDTGQELWAVPLAETPLDRYVDKGQQSVNANDSNDANDATLAGRIVDAQSYFNLKNLCRLGVIDATAMANFGRLLSNMGLPASLAQATAAMMAAAQRSTATAATAAQSSPPPSNLASQPLDLIRVEDLLAVPGFTNDMVERLKKFVVVLPQPTPINVNTASADVLAATIPHLSVTQAATLVENRAPAYFQTTQNFIEQLPSSAAAIPAAALAVNTHYFIVHSQIRLGRARVQLQALLERNGSNVSLVWVRPA